MQRAISIAVQRLVEAKQDVIEGNEVNALNVIDSTIDVLQKVAWQYDNLSLRLTNLEATVMSSSYGDIDKAVNDVEYMRKVLAAMLKRQDGYDVKLDNLCDIILANIADLRTIKKADIDI